MIDKGTPSTTNSRSNSSAPAGRREISVRTGVLVLHKHWLRLPTTALVTLPGGRVTFSTDELLHRSPLFPVPIQRTAIQYP